MSQVKVTWVEGHQFVGTDSTQHSVVISSPADGVGIKPSELLLLALGSCTAYDVVSILGKRRKEIRSLHVCVDGQQAEEAPWPFEKIHIHYEVAGPDLTEDEVEKAIKLSKEKYCSVSATLERGAEVTFDFTVITPEPA